MEYKSYICVFFVALCGNSSWADLYTESGEFTKEPALWSLRCAHAGEDKCKSALTDYALPHTENETFPDLELVFKEADPEIQKAFTHRGLSSLSGPGACQIPKPLLLLLPADYLSSMRGDVLGKLLNCNADDLAIVRLIGTTIEHLPDPYAFYSEIQSMKLGEDVLSILGEGIESMSSIYSAQWLISGHNSILEYLDPDIIIADKDKLLVLMKYMDPDLWNQRPQRIKRIWAYVLNQHDQHLNIADWDDSHLQTQGHFLAGSVVGELEQLTPSRIKNKTSVFLLPFSLLQIRGTFEDFYRYGVLTSADYSNVKHLIHQLLPKHLQQFYEGTLNLADLTHLKEPTSLATTKQIVEYMVSNNGTLTVREFISLKENLLALNQLVYSLPLGVLRELNYTLAFKEVSSLQHSKLTMGQLYYLTAGGSSYRLTTDTVRNAHEILKGLPTQLLSRSVPPTVYSYLMSELPGSVPPRTAALLDHLIFKAGNEKNFKSLFKNKDAKLFLSFLPSKFVERNHEQFLPALEHYIKLHPKFGNEIPEHVLSVLLTKWTNRNFSWGSFAWNNGSELYQQLLRGIACTDINRLSPVDFIHVISRYNSLRTTFGWVFPRNLQQCCLNKLVEYLEMKSAFMTHYLNTSLVSLMTSSDVEAVGGFVLASIPMTELRVAPQKDLIVKSIGKLTLPELLLACPADKLINIGELYYRPKLGKDIFSLGNLTVFLTVPNINTLDPTDFKLMLESGLMDRRVCALDNQRDAWANLIVEAFGPAERWKAQDLVTLGDMLMVIPHHDLSKVDPRVWAAVADIISNTGYVQGVRYSDRTLPFYEVCEKRFSDPYEATTYRRELSEFVGWLLTASQHQLDSVINASSMKAGIQRHPLSRPKMIDDALEVDPTMGAEGWSSMIIPFSSSRNNNGRGLLTKVSCDAIRMVGKPTELFLTTASIDGMGKQDIVDCKEEFGKMDLSEEVGLHIWNKLDKLESPHLAGKLLSHAGPTDVTGLDLSFGRKWTHEIMFYLANFNSNVETKSVLVSVVHSQRLSLLSVEDVVALGPLTCQLPDARVTVEPNVFFKASRHLGSYLPCDLPCLQYFSEFFQNVDAYGPMSEWTPEDVESLGILIAGLDFGNWTTLIQSDKQLLSQLGTRALHCLPKDHIKALTESAVKQLPVTTAAFFLNEFAFIMNSSIKTALNEHVTPEMNFKTPELQQFVYVWEETSYVPQVKESTAQLCQTWAPLLLTTLLIVVLNLSVFL